MDGFSNNMISSTSANEGLYNAEVIFNKNTQKDKRRFLRKNSTKAEDLLWPELRSRKLSGFKLKRQYGINYYIADFYCPEEKLVVEVDGGVNFTDEAQKYDQKRTEYINNLGINVIRFTNDDVFNNISGVLEKILETLTFENNPNQQTLANIKTNYLTKKRIVDNPSPFDKKGRDEVDK